MNADPSAARQAFQQAQDALRRGDRETARRWAEGAIALAPDWEEPWLLLAALSPPRASIACLQRALQINPQSIRARQGLAWVQKRLQENPPSSSPLEDTSPSRSQKRAQAVPATMLPPAAKDTAPTQPRSASLPRTRRKRPAMLWLFVVLLLGVIGGLALWSGGMTPALAWLGEVLPSPTPPALFYGAPAQVLKPTYTPTLTPTPTPTATFTPTFTPTATYTATLTPLPTNTPWPTATALPYFSPVPPVAEGDRWIDVDLSAQRLYAYQGSTLIAAFVVSTGTAQHPTVTGRYRIYLKLLYTDMAGPGYYLPDVPYTMYFYKGYAIHGTYWHNNFGVPMSHGCVNMRIDDAAWLYSWAPLGTLVNVHY